MKSSKRDLFMARVTLTGLIVEIDELDKWDGEGLAMIREALNLIWVLPGLYNLFYTEKWVQTIGTIESIAELHQQVETAMNHIVSNVNVGKLLKEKYEDSGIIDDKLDDLLNNLWGLYKIIEDATREVPKLQKANETLSQMAQAHEQLEELAKAKINQL